VLFLWWTFPLLWFWSSFSSHCLFVGASVSSPNFLYPYLLQAILTMAWDRFEINFSGRHLRVESLLWTRWQSLNSQARSNQHKTSRLQPSAPPPHSHNRPFHKGRLPCFPCQRLKKLSLRMGEALQEAPVLPQSFQTLSASPCDGSPSGSPGRRPKEGGFQYRWPAECPPY